MWSTKDRRKMPSYDDEYDDSGLKRRRSLPSRLKDEPETPQHAHSAHPSQKKLKIESSGTATTAEQMLKRPRGRPPLTAGKMSSSSSKGHKKKKSGSSHRPKPKVSAARFATVSAQLQSFPGVEFIESTTVAPPKVGKSGDTKSRSRGVGGPSGSSSNGKGRQTPISSLAQKVIGKMMTSEPISVSDLVTAIPEATVDLVQCIVDVLVIMGVVVSLKSPTVVSRGPPTVVPNVYTLVGFMRAPEPLDIAQFEAIQEAKSKNTELIRTRVQALRDLSSKSMTPEERCSALKSFVEDQIGGDPKLGEDSLYQAVIEMLSGV